MFSFLTVGEVNDDAIALKKLTDMAIDKYAGLTKEELVETLSCDFDENHHYVDNNSVNFIFKELDEFRFDLDLLSTDKPPYALTVVGNVKYLGFMLNAAVGSKWVCSSSNGIGYRATNGTKKLVKVMGKNFDIMDTSEFMKHYG